MSGADRPAAVRRWVRRPVWWGLAALAAAGALFLFDLVEADRFDRRFDRGLRVSGAISSSWDGGQEVVVRYRHPDTGDEVGATTFVWETGRLPKAPGPVDLEVSRSDPTDVVLAGDRFPATANLLEYLPWTLFPFVIWAVRAWTVRATERLMAAGTVGYAMVASASPPGRWGLRWRLHLHPADAGVGAPPVCTVPLVDRPVRGAPFPVEVKGLPRPFARVVARHREDGAVLWPSGRALRVPGRAATADATANASTAAAPPDPTERRGRRVVMAAAVVLVVSVVGSGFGTYADVVRDRQWLVPAEVTDSRPGDDGGVEVDVAYDWAGRRRTGTVTEPDAPPPDGALIVRVDPESPDRVWSTTQDRPPGTTEGELPGLGILVGLALLLTGGALRYLPDR